MFHGDTGERTKVRSSRNSVPTMWSQPCGTPGAWRQLRNTYSKWNKLDGAKRRLAAIEGSREGGGCIHAKRTKRGAGAIIAIPFVAAPSSAATETPLTIEQLLAQGWEIAGYASGYDNRTSLILFRHPGVNKLVQCGILYDVTRTPRTVVNCYELR
jgi:hypothetical protein